MERNLRAIVESDLPVVEHEGTATRDGRQPIYCKHASKHMSFSTDYAAASEVMEREDGVGYDQKTGKFYQTKNFRR